MAGNGQVGFSGDGGPATQAAIGYTEGIAVDASGNFYTTQYLVNRVRKVANGIINTVAGNGTAGFGGDGGPATAAQLNSPVGIALDSRGNLFIADEFNNRIRRVDARTGIITTVAGDGTTVFKGDGGPATQASLLDPTAVAFDSSDNMFIADLGHERMRRVDALSQTISTVAGNGVLGFSGDGGLATMAEISAPWGVAADSQSNLYIGDLGNNRVRAVHMSPAVNLPHSLINFGNQQINTTSNPHLVVLQNTGAATLTISSISTTGNFAQMNNCGSTLAPATYCTISITFTPRILGVQNGTVVVVDNASPGTQVIYLIGYGTP